MAITPTPITALPTPPLRSDPVNFSSRADAFLGAFPDLRDEINAISTVNYDNTVLSEAKATAATSSASQALASEINAGTYASTAASVAGATMWVSGTNYSLGAIVWSPMTGGTFRCILAGVSSIDPSADSTRWGNILGAQSYNIRYYGDGVAGFPKLIDPNGEATIVLSGLGDNNLHLLDFYAADMTVSGVKITLPANPGLGAIFRFIVITSESVTIFFNGQKFRGVSTASSSFTNQYDRKYLVYCGTQLGWV